jgi:two-component system phosphate regulon response regulator PhoB
MARVLVVDDQPDLRNLLKVSLSLAGHEVSLAADGRRGLDMARELRPEVVVLDVMMPGLDGWSVLASLKSDPEPAVASIPVLMLTARTEDLDMIRGGIEGAVRYLTKPFAIDDLRDAVAGAVADGPEAEQRRAAQHKALAHLARLERGTGTVDNTSARPRLSRLEPARGARQARGGTSSTGEAWPSWVSLEVLTARDRQILETVRSCPSLAEARVRLQVSRSYLYARLRSMANKLDFDTGPALVKALRLSTPAIGRARLAVPAPRAPR